MVGVVLQFIGGIIVSLFQDGVLKFLALKGLLFSLFCLVLPVVLYNLFSRIMQEILQYASSQIEAGVSTTVYQFVGLGAWVANEMNLAASVGIFLSIVALKWTISLIPGL